MTESISDRLRAALADRYELLSELGAGGMATVYLARDLKHDRKVAVKVLRPELAAVIGGERFITEIKTTAALQHPHILPLFDSGEADSFLYYVMPFVEGESLRAKLDRERQFEVDEAIHIAKAVASALQYAHERDVIHRDIKPENILLHAGEPVVADFGIALAISAAGGGRMTETGLSLGTPHYMSPEQAAADRDLSARSDVYSLACVLYEMLAGQPPHTGPTAQSILVRILTEDPRPVSDARPTVPKHIRAVVSKGLEKLPADRFKSAEEFKVALDDTAFTHERVAVTGGFRGGSAAHTSGVRDVADGAGGPPVAGGLRTRLHAAATVVLAAATAWLAFGNRGVPATATDLPFVSFVAMDSAGAVGQVDVGPNGTIAYIMRGQIFVRAPGALEATPIPGVEDAQDIAISPDGQWIVFEQNEGAASHLRKIQIAGGSVANVWSGSQLLAITISWGEDGWIYFASGNSVPNEIRRVPEVGGEDEILLDLSLGFAFHPKILPSAKALIFTLTNSTASEARVVRLDLESGDTTTLVPEGFDARWTPTGHLLYGHTSGALWTVPFDQARGVVTGPATPVLEGLGTSNAFTNYAFNGSGTLAFVSGSGSSSAGGAGLYYSLVDEAGNRERLPIEPTDHPDARISPDGSSLAYVRAGDVWVFDLDRGSNVPLTEGGSGQHNPIWSPDGTRIVYRADDDLKVRVVDRSEEAVSVTSSEQPDNPMVWLDDGTIIVGTEGLRGGDLIAVTVDSPEPPRPLLDANWQERGAAVSPDGHWIAYSSARGGDPQLYVRSWPELQRETLISNQDGNLAGAMYPQWSWDSRTLYYQKRNQVFAADLNTAGPITVTGARTLPFTVSGILQDIHPDGRLLVTDPSGAVQDTETGGPVPQLVISTNWFTELRARLGGGE